MITLISQYDMSIRMKYFNLGHEVIDIKSPCIQVVNVKQEFICMS